MKLSAVIVSRNDNYGGHLLERAVFALNSMCQTFDEVIYIDWNSDTETTLAEDAKINSDKLKIIRVSPELAKTILGQNYAKAQKCCEVLGRNIGIRRATGDIIVSTNIDIIAPSRQELDLFIEKEFNANTFYITRRKMIQLNSAQFLFQQCNFDHEQLRTSLSKFNFPMAQYIQDKHSIILCCGDFQMAHKDMWYKLKGFNEDMIYRYSADSEIQERVSMLGYKIIVTNLSIYHLEHERTNETWNNWVKEKGHENSDDWGCVKHIPL